MRSYRNPFRARTLEQQSQAGVDEFLKIFSPGVLDLLPESIWDRPLFILTAYTEHVPEVLPDGTPGFTAANTLIGTLARRAWDALGA